MTTVQLNLTAEEERWLSDWSTLSGYQTTTDGIIEVLKVVGAIPKGEHYWRKRFDFAE